MAALAYLVPPLSGLICYLWSRDKRVRFHGLQSIVIGAAWPALIYIFGAFSTILTRVVFVAGAFVWIAFLIAALFGSDPALPGIASRIRRTL